jgi:hypothetical protein
MASKRTTDGGRNGENRQYRQRNGSNGSESGSLAKTHLAMAAYQHLENLEGKRKGVSKRKSSGNVSVVTKKLSKAAGSNKSSVAWRLNGGSKLSMAKAAQRNRNGQHRNQRNIETRRISVMASAQNRRNEGNNQ